MTKERFLHFFDIEADGRNLELLTKACSYWNLGDDDLARCIETAVQYHRTDLLAIRKILGVYLLEWMEPFDGGWTRRIYFNVPGTITWMYWIRSLAVGSTYAGSPDFISMAVLYGLFGREEKVETGNCRHCAVNLMRSALITDPSYPDADVQVSFGFTCDEAPKQDDLTAAAMPDGRMLRYVIANPVRGRSEPNYVREDLSRALEGLRKRGVLPAAAQEDDRKYSKLKSARFRLATRVHQVIDLVGSSREFRITNNDIVFIESLLITTFACGMERIEALLAELLREMKTTGGTAVKYRFCVYYTPICNPEYGAIMEKNGLALLDQTAFSNSAIYTGKTDPCEDAALEGSGMLIAGSAEDEGKKIANLINRKSLDGFVSGMFAFDRWMGMQQHRIKTIIEETTGKTAFLYDTDFWNQESFSADKMSTTVETLCYMLESQR